MYEESIQESRESIRLSMLVREGSALSARDLARLEEERKKSETTKTEPTEGGRSYTVQKTRPAESLWRISSKKEVYGKGSKWTKIYDANRDKIKNPDLIFPGQELVIPEE
jgi:nucleoid-associated protein YgaU